MCERQGHMSQNIQQHDTRIDHYKSERLTPINRYLLVEPTTIFLERLYVIQSKNKTSVSASKLDRNQCYRETMPEG